MSSSARSQRVWILVAAAALIGRVVLMTTIPVMDPTEGRYAEVARQMLVTHNWLVPQIWIDGDLVPFLGKPPLHFWGMALALRVLGADAFAARLPALVTALMALGLIVFVLDRFATRRRAVAAAAMTASSALFFLLAGTAATDMTLAFCILGALLATMAFLAETDPSRQQRWSLGVFAFLGLGFMVKGPVAIILYGLPVFFWHVWNGRWTDLRQHLWGRGIALFAVITVPWFALSEIRNPGFLNYFFIHENLLRYTVREYGDLYGSGHVYPYGSAVWMLVVAALPWSILALAAPLWRVSWRPTRTDLQDPFRGLALITTLTTMLFWCACRQLLITYLVPAVPMVAIWVALKAPGCDTSKQVLTRWAIATAACLVVIMTAASPFMGNRHSARALARKACELIVNGEGDVFMMARHTPYSAYFYAKDKIFPHGDESLSLGLDRVTARRQRCIVGMSDRQLKRLDTSVLGEPVMLGAVNSWRLVRFPSVMAVGGGLQQRTAEADAAERQVAEAQ